MVRKVVCLACAMLLIASVTAYADTIMTLDLDITGGSSSITAVGQTVTLTLYAEMQTTSDTLEQLIYGYTTVESSGAGMGDLSTVALVNLTVGNTTGAATDYDSNSDDEWGGTNGGESIEGFIMNTSTTPATGSKITLSTIVWTCTDLGAGTVDINTFDWNQGDEALTTGDTATVSGTYYNGYALGNFTADMIAHTGVTLDIVPEPSTLILLGMAALGLLAIRRRK